MKRGLSSEFALVLALGVFWGLNWPTVKILLTEIAPWTLRAWGLSLGAVGLAGLAVAVRQSLIPAVQDIRPLIVTGLLSILGFNLFSAFGQLLTATSSAVIVGFTMPMWAALLAVLFLGEKLSINRIMSLIVGMAGLALLVHDQWDAFITRPGGPLFMLCAALSWAAGTVALKAHRWSVEPVARAAWLVGVSAPFAILGAFLLEAPLKSAVPSPKALAVLGYHVIFPMIICHAGWVMLVARLPASVAAIGTLLIPVVGVASAAAILGDDLSAIKLTALALVLLSVALTFAAPNPPRPETDEPHPSGGHR